MPKAANKLEMTANGGDQGHGQSSKKRKGREDAIRIEHASTTGAAMDQKRELLEYLRTERQIVKKNPLMAIDDDERQLLDSLSDQVIDFDQFFKAKVKAKDKLWRIPYSFRKQTPGEADEHSDEVLHRFGKGVQEGAQMLKLPSKPLGVVKKVKNWQDLLDDADDALDLYTHPAATMVDSRTRRRGSIFQPRVFMSPNPEVDCGDKFLLSGLALPLRDWTSELVMTSWRNEASGGGLLDEAYKWNVCKNNSLEELDKIPFADLKTSGAFGLTSELMASEVAYYQSVRNHRRQSLVPPNFGAGVIVGGGGGGQATELRFRRQSYAGGQLWSPKVESNVMKEAYYKRIKLINPHFVRPRSEKEEDKTSDESESEELQTLANLKAKINEFEDFPVLDYRNKEQARLFAHELTLIVRQHFVAVRESEMINFMVQPGATVLNTCQNIKGMLHFQNRVIRLIATYIVNKENMTHALRAMLFFIEVAVQLLLLGNWHSVNLVIQSLQCPPVARLKEVWRKITFNHAESYDNFFNLSEQLETKGRLECYEEGVKYIVIFDDLVERLKELCGFKLVQIYQYRLHSNWQHSKDDDIVNWISKQIDELIGEIDASNVRTTTVKSKRKRRSFISRLFHLRKRKEIKENESFEVMEDYASQSFRAGLLSLKPTNNSGLGRLMPSCRRFWSVAEFNKLKSADREPIKQEIVRTLVHFQKKAFYVFEERDARLKRFLLDSVCDSMDTCMLKSRRIEIDKNVTKPSTFATEESDADEEEIKIIPDDSSKKAQFKTRTPRRVMFA